MPPRKGGAETSKKAQGQARKADQAAKKQAAKEDAVEADEAQQWKKGSKDTSKAEQAAIKAQEAARKKAEKAALAAEEEASLPTGGGKNHKTAVKKNAKPAPAASRGGGLDAALGALDGKGGSSSSAGAGAGAGLSATGIDDALDALSLATGSTDDKVDRHPERRFKAAYTVFEERRLEEMKEEKGLRRQQKIELIRKEFEKHPDNPFNQVNAVYNSTKQELSEIRKGEKDKLEKRLGGPA